MVRGATGAGWLGARISRRSKASSALIVFALRFGVAVRAGAMGSCGRREATCMSFSGPFAGKEPVGTAGCIACVDGLLCRWSTVIATNSETAIIPAKATLHAQREVATGRSDARSSIAAWMRRSKPGEASASRSRVCRA